MSKDGTEIAERAFYDKERNATIIISNTGNVYGFKPPLTGGAMYYKGEIIGSMASSTESIQDILDSGAVETPLGEK